MPRQDQMLDPAVPVEPEPAPPHLAGIARGAALIAGLTMLSRMLGLVRTLVFSQSIGASCLGTAYITANQVPDLVYELIVGGAKTADPQQLIDAPHGVEERRSHRGHLIKSSRPAPLGPVSRRAR